MQTTNEDQIAVEKVVDLIRNKMEQKFFGSILVPMKYGKLGKLKIEEILDVTNKEHILKG